MSTQSTRPGWVTLARDTASYLIGVTLLAKQAGIFFTPPSAPNDTLIWIGALLIGVPGVAQIIAWRFGGGTPSSSSQSAGPLSSGRSSLSGNNGDGE